MTMGSENRALFSVRARSQGGMTLIEATIILSVVAVLTAILAPSVNGYVEQARQARAREDVQTIGEAIQSFITDTAEHQFLWDGNGTVAKEPPTRPDTTNRVNLLVSDGDIPTRSSALVALGDSFWLQGVNGAEVDALSSHLVENAPGDTAGNRYRNPSDILTTSVGNQNIDFARVESSGLNAPHSWRGPYLRGPVDPDPWGNRYAVNVAFLDPSPTAVITGITTPTPAFDYPDYPRLDVFVLSAGPDEEIDTYSAQDGAVPGDDDFIYLVSSHAK